LKLRPLEKKDAARMLAWMKDERVNKYFQFDPEAVSADTVSEFIANSRSGGNSVHFAVADDDDTYLGTVSLKNINAAAKNAEYAIALCHDSQGRGAGKFATIEILKYAFTTLGLESVYLNVFSDNERAISLYQKCGFVFEGEFRKHIYKDGELKNLKWFRVMKQ